MNSIKERAEQFFDACETGKGWDMCKEFCHPDASFSAQAGALADVDTLESYTEWMKRNLSTTMGHSTGLIREQCPVW